MHCDKYIPVWRAVGRGLISRRFDFFSISAAASHRPTAFSFDFFSISAAASHRPTVFSENAERGDLQCRPPGAYFRCFDLLVGFFRIVIICVLSLTDGECLFRRYAY